MPTTVAAKLKAIAAEENRKAKQAQDAAIAHQLEMKRTEPARAKERAKKMWPALEEALSKAARQGKKELHYYRDPTFAWVSTSHQDKEPATITVLMYKEIKKLATGINVELVTRMIPGADPRSGGIDGPQWVEWDTWSHDLHFTW